MKLMVRKINMIEDLITLHGEVPCEVECANAARL